MIEERSKEKRFEELCTNFEEVQSEITGLGFDKFCEERLTYGWDTGAKFKLLQLGEGYSPIDAGIAPVIEYLNKGGYKTLYCCEGHEKRLRKGKVRNSAGYIFFDRLAEAQEQRLLMAANKILLSGKVYVLVDPNVEDKRGDRYSVPSRLWCQSRRNATGHHPSIYDLKRFGRNPISFSY